MLLAALGVSRAEPIQANGDDVGGDHDDDDDDDGGGDGDDDDDDDNGSKQCRKQKNSLEKKLNKRDEKLCRFVIVRVSLMNLMAA